MPRPVFPPKAYLQIANFGELVICELSVPDAGDIEKAAQSITDETVAFHLLEDGVMTDASEDVAAAWMRLNRDTVDFDDGVALVPQFIVTHAGEALDQLAGERAESARNNRPPLPEHHFVGGL